MDSTSDKNIAVLSCGTDYSKFTYGDTTITFIHGLDLIKYLKVNEWDNGYLAVSCLGKVKGEYEDYIDLADIMENLYMDPERCLKNINKVVIG